MDICKKALEFVQKAEARGGEVGEEGDGKEEVCEEEGEEEDGMEEEESDGAAAEDQGGAAEEGGEGEVVRGHSGSTPLNGSMSTTTSEWRPAHSIAPPGA